MALGNNDNNKKEQYLPVYYSDYKAGNAEGIDPSCINYSFYNRLLKISISPLKANNGNNIAYDHENAAEVWLTHTKARMLADQIRKVLAGEISNGGVTTGKDGLIRFTDGKELGIPNYALIVNKVDENCNVVSGYAYEFKTKHHYAVENFDTKDAKHKKQYYNTLEVQQLLDLLEQYYLSMTGAMAYSVMDGLRFKTNETVTKIDLVMSKLGVEYKTGMTSRQTGYSGSYFDNKGISSNTQERTVRTATMDELE